VIVRKEIVMSIIIYNRTPLGVDGEAIGVAMTFRHKLDPVGPYVFECPPVLSLPEALNQRARKVIFRIRNVERPNPAITVLHG
jgi:hypothetical protein